MSYLPLLVAGVVSLILGSLWYSPMMFGKEFMKEMGADKMSKEQMEKGKKGMWMAYLVTLLGAILTAHVLRFVLGLFAVNDWMTGAMIGFTMWLGFIFATSIGGQMFMKKSWKMYWINMGFDLVLLLVLGAMLGVWR